MTPGPILALILTLAAVSNTDKDICAQESARYQATVAVLTEALRDYEKCVLASRGRDPCTTEWEDLDVAQDKFETAVEDRGRLCPMTAPKGDR